jgi:hypothetical protein
MKRRRWLLAVFLGITLIVALVLVYAYQRSPYYVTLEQIQVGMTIEEVTAVIGRPAFFVGKGKSNDGPWTIGLVTWQVEHGYINVDFDSNERVRSRSFRHERGNLLQRLIRF